MSRRSWSPRARSGFAFGLVAIQAMGIGCGDDGGGVTDPGPTNQAPVATGTIPAQTVAVGENAGLALSSFFSDPDGDVLTYQATSSNALVAGVSVSGSQLTMVGVSRGDAVGTVTARDTEGVEARQSFDLTVCIPVPEDVLHWWAGDGTGVDIVGGLDATLMNGAAYVQGVAGTGDEAFSFDGVDAIAVVPDAPTLSPVGPFTVMAWARTGSVPRPNGAIVGKGHPWAESWVLDTHRDRWRAVIRQESGFSTTAYGSEIEPGVWTHVAMRWDGQVLALYVDGQLVEAEMVGSINVSDGPVGIGARSERGFSDDELDLEFEGAIDDVMFFGRALGEEEIRSVVDNTTFGLCNL